MKRFAVIVLFAVCGCSSWIDSPQRDDEIVKPRKETIWTLLAEDVDAGLIDNSTTLELIVDRLRKRSHLTDSEVEAFYEAFPGITETEREITKADSSRLRKVQ